MRRLIVRYCLVDYNYDLDLEDAIAMALLGQRVFAYDCYNARGFIVQTDYDVAAACAILRQAFPAGSFSIMKG